MDNQDVTNQPSATLVFYDGNCGFCRWSLTLALRFDKNTRLQPLPLQTPGLLAAHSIALADAEKALHVVTPEGQVVQAGWALWAILRELPWWRAARVLWYIPGFAALADWGYYRIANNRDRLGRYLAYLGINVAQCRLASG
jgi:predicted DCC family thiol-disulfide oxidoreductase YuxK